MATEEVATVKEVKLIDLDDYLMQKLLSKMSITEQIAVTRVCKRIEANAFKLTTTMIATDLPHYFRIGMLAALPKLKNIFIFWLPRSLDQSEVLRVKEFLEFVVALKPKIERINGLLPQFISHFIEHAKEERKDGYDSSTFKTLLAFKEYEELLLKFPGIKIRHRTRGFEELDSMGERTREERLSDPNLKALNVSTPLSKYNFSDIITKTKNLTNLIFRHKPANKHVKPNFSHIFDSVTNLPLKKFFLSVVPETAGTDYDWVKQDFDSFRNFLKLKSLVEIRFIFDHGEETYMETLKCFLDSPRNNYQHFAMHGYTDDSLANFMAPAGEHPQLVPSMRLKFQSGKDSFPIAEFIQKFSPKYREFLIKDRKTMVKMIKDCTDLIRNKPKVHFVFYANEGSKWTISFRPFQLEDGKMKFSVQLSPSHIMKKQQFF